MKNKHPYIGRQMSMISRHMKVLHDRQVRSFGLSGQQVLYLIEVAENPGVSQEEISRLFHIDKGTVAKSVKQFMDKDFVIREQNPEDKRAYKLFPTEKTLEISREGRKNGCELEKALTKGMTEEEVKTLEHLMEKLCRNIEEMGDNWKEEEDK